VVVIHRTYDKTTAIEVAEFFRAMGSRIVVQEDDDLRALARTAAASSYFSKIPDPALIAGLATIADRMIVTTAALAEYYRQWCSEVRVIPNYLPSRFFVASSPDRSPRRTVYAGTVKSHAMDLDWLRPSASAIEDLTALGDPGVYEHLQIRRGRSIPWISRARDYYSNLRRFDVGIVPLAPNPFNDAKSWLKALDYAASGLGVVASRTPANSELAALIPEIVIVDTAEEMVDRIAEAPRIDGEKLLPILSLEAHASDWRKAVTDWD
jgi:hypothetical protein